MTKRLEAVAADAPRSPSVWLDMSSQRQIINFAGTPVRHGRYPHRGQFECEQSDSGLSAEVNRVMDSIIYLVGLIVVVMFILSALGLR